MPTITELEASSAPFTSLVTYRILGKPVPGSEVLAVTALLRASVMSRVKRLVGPDNIPAAVHGHQDNAPHVAYLALPRVGDPHATGLIHGVAVAVPAGLLPDDSFVLKQALEADGGLSTLSSTKQSPSGPLKLAVRKVVPADTLSTTRASAWASDYGSFVWASATPIMLDRHPHRNENPAQLVAESCVSAGYPAPVEVELADEPFLRGAVRYGPGWKESLGRRPIRPVFHAMVRFAEPIMGPVLVGSLRFQGGGLLAPLPWLEKLP